MSDYDDQGFGGLYEEGAPAPGKPGPGVQHFPARTQRIGTRSLYSCRRFEFVAPGVIAPGRYALFTTAVGQPGQGFAAGMTNWATNMKIGGQMAPGESYVVNKIGVYLPAWNSWEDSIGFDLTANLYYSKRSATWELGPMAFYPAGAGLTGAGASTTNPVANFVPLVSNGVPAFGALVDLEDPIEIESGAQFGFGFEICAHAAWTITRDFYAFVRLYSDFAEAVAT